MKQYYRRKFLMIMSIVGWLFISAVNFIWTENLQMTLSFAVISIFWSLWLIVISKIPYIRVSDDELIIWRGPVLSKKAYKLQNIKTITGVALNKIEFIYDDLAKGEIKQKVSLADLNKNDRLELMNILQSR